MHPLLFAIGPFHVYGYGAMIVLGGIAAFSWIYRNRADAGLGKSDDDFWLLINVVLIAGFIGGRSLYLIEYTKLFSAEFWKALISPSSGFSLLGGFISMPLCIYGFCRWRGIEFLRLCDYGGIGTMLWNGIGRLGCFMAGCCHGRPTDAPWAVVFTDPKSQVDPHLLGVPIHPTQLYEFAGNLTIAGLLYLVLRANRDKPRGLAFAGFFAAYGLERFVLEFYRGDTVPSGFGWLTGGQLMCLGLFGGAAAILAGRASCIRRS